VVSPRSRATLAYVAAFAAIGAAFPYLPVHYRALGLDLAAIGALGALWAAASLVAAPAWGALTDRLPRSRVLLPAAALLSAAAALGLSQAHDLPAVAIGVAAVAGATSGVTPMLDARTLDILGDDRGQFGRIRAWGSISFIVSTVCVGLIMDRWGDDALFAVYVPMYVVTAVVALWLPRSRRSSATGSLRAGASRVIRAPGMAVFLAAALLTWTSVVLINSFLSVRLVDLGAPAGLVGMAWVVGSIVEVPIMFAFPRLAARFGAHRLLLLGAVFFAVRGCLYVLADRPDLLVAGGMLEGAGFGLFFVASVGYVAELAPRGRIATAQGVHSAMAFGVAAVIGAALGGAIATAITIPGLFAVGAVASVISVGVLALALRAAPRAAPTGPAPVDSTVG
jgi:PPP family 3-phenylpropionic acid transporter